jgi:hypothetical protein
MLELSDNTIVYGLEDPRDHLYHYVGITDNVYERFAEHVKGSGGNIRKNGWIWECRQSNVMILMREIERVSPDVAKEREEFWIRYYFHLGHPLQNSQVVKSILEQRDRLEVQYQQLLASKAKLEEQVIRLETEQVEEKITRSRAKAIDIAKIVQLRMQRYSLRDISAATGISYYHVQKVAMEHADLVIDQANQAASG